LAKLRALFLSVHSRAGNAVHSQPPFSRPKAPRMTISLRSDALTEVVGGQSPQAVTGFGAIKLSRRITLGRPSDEPLVDFGLNPGDATIAYRHWLGETRQP
jgi:hypothetical protein